MRIWIDADACPRPAKELIFKNALKYKLEVILVAGQGQVKPTFNWVKLIVVPTAMDAADDYLVEHTLANDLVICSDIPLADRLIKKKVYVLDPKGKEFTLQNMGERLALRNLFTDLRETANMHSYQAPYSSKDKQYFANALDRLLTKLNPCQH